MTITTMRRACCVRCHREYESSAPEQVCPHCLKQAIMDAERELAFDAMLEVLVRHPVADA